MKKHSETAVELFGSGLNCAQSVFAAFCEAYGMSKEMGLKTACGLGGGLRCAEVCGVVSGAVMVIGLKHGQCVAGDQASKSKCYSETVHFIQTFKSRNKTIICREILGCDISTKEGMEKALSGNLFQTTCIDMIVGATELLEELGY